MGKMRPSELFVTGAEVPMKSDGIEGFSDTDYYRLVHSSLDVLEFHRG